MINQEFNQACNNDTFKKVEDICNFNPGIIEDYFSRVKTKNIKKWVKDYLIEAVNTHYLDENMTKDERDVLLNEIRAAYKN